MQYCSLQRQVLLLSPVPFTTGCCFCFGSIPSFLLELFLHWSPVAYWAPSSISALLTMPKPLTVWITINCGKFWKRWEYQTTHLTCLLRNLYAGQEATVRTGHGTTMWIFGKWQRTLLWQGAAVVIFSFRQEDKFNRRQSPKNFVNGSMF